MHPYGTYIWCELLCTYSLGRLGGGEDVGSTHSSVESLFRRVSSNESSPYSFCGWQLYVYIARCLQFRSLANCYYLSIAYEGESKDG